MQVLSAKRREGNCTNKYLRGLRNQNGDHLVNICESNIIETQVSELARILFPVECKIDKNEKKLTTELQQMHAFTYEYLLNQSVFYQVSNTVSDGVFKRKCSMEK